MTPTPLSASLRTVLALALASSACTSASEAPAPAAAPAVQDEAPPADQSPPPELGPRLRALDALLAEARRVSAVAGPVDYDGLRRDLAASLTSSDGSARAYVAVLWSAMLAIGHGHQILAPMNAGDEDAVEALGMLPGPYTRYDACLRPYADHAVVTTAAPGGVLRRGDEIVAVDGRRGDELARYLASQPLATEYLPPTADGARAFVLRAFLGVDREGMRLTVKRAGGEVEVKLPRARPRAEAVSCDDPFGRDTRVAASAKMLDDGTGVLFVPTFAEPDLATFEAQVGPAFDKVKDAKRLVVDVRGNGGGLLRSALSWASQLPGARKVDTVELWDRTPGSDPPAFVFRSRHGVDPASVTTPRFAFSGKVAILVDGATHSSAEHFARAAHLGANVRIVGTRTAGAYGAVNADEPLTLDAEPKLIVSFNRSQARDTSGAPLDRSPVLPDVEVGYEPAALARSEDAMLTAAIADLATK